MRVSAVDPKTGEILKEDGVVEAESGKKVDIRSDHLPSKDYPLEAQLLTKEDITEEFIKRNLDQEDLKEEKIREVFEKVNEALPSAKPSLRFRDFISEEREEVKTETENENESLEESREEVKISEEPKLENTPVVTATSTPRLTTTPKPISTILSTPTPEPIIEIISPNSGGAGSSADDNVVTATPTPSATPQPIIQTSLTSITPKSIEISLEKQEVVINGQKLTGTKQVFIGQSTASFFVLDESTIFATIPKDLEAGVYDIAITTSKGENIRLNNALTLR